MNEIIMAALMGLVFGAGGGCLWAYCREMVGAPNWLSVGAVGMYNIGLVVCLATWSPQITMNHYVSLGSMVVFECIFGVMVWLVYRRPVKKGGATS